MDEQAAERLHAAVLGYARWKVVADPAIEPLDFVQEGWAKAWPVLRGVEDEQERIALLKWAISRAVLDLHKKAKLRRREPFGEWLPSGQDVEAEALAALTLRPILDRALAGHPATLSLVAIGLGYTWHQVKAGAGVSQRALHGWHCARAEVLA